MSWISCSRGTNPSPAALGQFKVDTLARYTEKDRPAKPNWTFNVPIDTILDGLQIIRSKFGTKNIHTLLGLARNADHSASVFHAPPGPMWSPAALCLFAGDEKLGADNIGRMMQLLQIQLCKLEELKGGQN